MSFSCNLVHRRRTASRLCSPTRIPIVASSMDRCPTASTFLSPVNSAIQLVQLLSPKRAPRSGAFNKPDGAVRSVRQFERGRDGSGCQASPIRTSTLRLQALIDPNGSYPTYDVVPTGTQLSTVSYGVPNNATLAVTYHHNQLQFHAAPAIHHRQPLRRTGAATWRDPATCAPLAGSVSGDPRYPMAARDSLRCDHLRDDHRDPRSGTPASSTRSVLSSSRRILACTHRSRTTCHRASRWMRRWRTSTRAASEVRTSRG